MKLASIPLTIRPLPASLVAPGGTVAVVAGFVAVVAGFGSSGPLLAVVKDF